MTDSAVKDKSDPKPIPLPRKLFSLTAKPSVPPLVPIPAPALISPVGFSSTLILTIFKPVDDPSIIADSTSLKKFSAFKLFMVFLCGPVESELRQGKTGYQDRKENQDEEHRQGTYVGNQDGKLRWFL